MKKICAILIVVGSCSGFIDLRYMTGFLLGTLAALLLFYRTHSFWNDVLDTGHSEKNTGTFHFAGNYAIMAGVLLLAAFFPGKFNIFACTAGLLLIKISAYIDAFLPARENRE